MNKLLMYAKESGYFNSIDYHFAKVVAPNNTQHQLLALLVSHAYGMKHTMIPYNFIYEENNWIINTPHEKAQECTQKLLELAGIHNKEDWDKVFDELRHINNHPISLTESGIYLTKNLNYEKIISSFLKDHQNTENNSYSDSTIELLHQLFPKEPDLNNQKLAAANALLSQVSIISGGPGTGKTTTVIKILLLLLNDNPNLHISLAAPTGKAAARLSESIEKQKSQFKESHPELTALLDKIPNGSTTLHRLLSFNPSQIRPKFHKYHPLPTDLIIIDEASMIDLYIFNLFIQAVPKHVRVIILGDKDQLASVEAGAIMSEVCQDIGYDSVRFEQLEKILEQPIPRSELSMNPPLNTVTLLTKSHRFTEDSGIGQLAKVVNNQEYRMFLPTIEKFPNELSFVNASDRKEQKPWLKAISILLSNYIQLCQNGASITELFTALHTVRILCATNISDFGTHAINEYISTELFKTTQNQRLYHGQAIMIQQNDYVNKVFNGDVGIIIEENNRLTAYFESDSEPNNQQNKLRAIPVQLLPHYETAFAMTIHKSQGSEFDDVIVVLPNFSSKILTKELLYTGITRAKKNLTIIGTPYNIQQTITQKTQRFSSIAQQLKS